MDERGMREAECVSERDTESEKVRERESVREKERRVRERDNETQC